MKRMHLLAIHEHREQYCRAYVEYAEKGLRPAFAIVLDNTLASFEEFRTAETALYEIFNSLKIGNVQLTSKVPRFDGIVINKIIVWLPKDSFDVFKVNGDKGIVEVRIHGVLRSQKTAFVKACSENDLCFATPTKEKLFLESYFRSQFTSKKDALINQLAYYLINYDKCITDDRPIQFSTSKIILTLLDE